MKKVNEQTGSGGGTNSSTFQPAVGPNGSASKSGAFPGRIVKISKKKTKIEEEISGAIDFYGRVKRSSVKEK